MVRAIKQGAHTSVQTLSQFLYVCSHPVTVLVRLYTPCHSSCCTSFSALHSCFPMFFPVRLIISLCGFSAKVSGSLYLN